MSTGKKTSGRKTKMVKEEQEQEQVQVDQPTEVKQSTQDLSQSAPIVTDWSKDSNKIEVDNVSEDETNTSKFKSVLDFDREQTALIDVGDVANVSDEDLLKILIRRGEMKKNPAISSGCKRVLRQINSETSFKPHFNGPRRNNNNNFRFNNGPRQTAETDSVHEETQQNTHSPDTDRQKMYQTNQNGDNSRNNRHYNDRKPTYRNYDNENDNRPHRNENTSNGNDGGYRPRFNKDASENTSNGNDEDRTRKFGNSKDKYNNKSHKGSGRVFQQGPPTNSQ